MQDIEIHSSVERSTGPKWRGEGGEKEGALSFLCSFSAPNVLLHLLLPSLPTHLPLPLPAIDSTPGRWLQILQGPLSIPLAGSHIPEQHMFHLKPTRFALPSGAKEKTLARAAQLFLRGGGGGEGPLGREKLCVLRITEVQATLGPGWGHLPVHSELLRAPTREERTATSHPRPAASHAAHLVLQAPGLASTPLAEPACALPN